MLTNLAPAGGRKELSFGNGTLQVFFYSIFAFLFITVLLSVFGLKSLEINIILSGIAKSVGIYLGIQFAMSLISKYPTIYLIAPIYILVAFSLVTYFPVMFLPLVGMPALIALVNHAFWFKEEYFKPSLIIT